jgi:hypothetical protein
MVMKDSTREAIRKHGQQLLAIYPKATEREPLELCRRLHRLERRAGAFALRLCNGPEFSSEEIEDKQRARILQSVDELLKFSEAGPAVFLNGDPRGYALKIDDEDMRKGGYALHTDFGGYGIIAPEIK